MERIEVKEQKPEERAKNFKEVCLGYTLEEAKKEASRCLKCKNPMCVKSCPVAIDIPEFISKVEEGKIEEAYEIIQKNSTLPAICGRVCPQESQCEGSCVKRFKSDAIAIGKLERFVADWVRENKKENKLDIVKNNIKIAIVGSGPAGLTCAGELAKKGYNVTIFEALHKPGGVLTYGIPEFRLPKEEVVNNEIENLKKLGVKIECNVVIGKTLTIEQLQKEYEAIFIATGAGLPRFMNIPGENANGVFSANEYLTRVNLMKAFKEQDTPVYTSKKVAVIGGGNVAMDAARTALRLGNEVYIIYRRDENEMPARKEEIHHAKEEGIKFKVLSNPIEVLVDEANYVKGLKCIEMELGEPDDSGRRRPVPKLNSEFEIEVDTVIMALGTSPNPIILSNAKDIQTNKYGCIQINEENCSTSKDGIFAGGDITSGAATVILAMEAGKKAAIGIEEYIKNRKK